MSSAKGDRSLVVVELVGGNDPLNTIIPYGSGLYYDFRPAVGIPQQEVLTIDSQLGFNPDMGPGFAPKPRFLSKFWCSLPTFGAE